MPKTGYVTLLGLPNAGKSTLLNSLIGEKLSIVTPKAQTTWQRVTGIVTERDVQMIFLDTPGLLDPKDLFQKSMLESARIALEEADVVVLVLDAAREEGAGFGDLLARSSAPRVAAVNKVDAASPGAVAAAVARAEALGARAVEISALNGTGIATLRSAIEEALPEGPFLYPADEIASEPVRFFVAELVRETIFERYHQEIPYSVLCHVEEFREEQDPVYVGVTVFVERESQKGILVGKKGADVRGLGTAARAKIEHFLGRSVYLDLWVKTLDGWRRKRDALTRYGFHVPDETR